MRKTQQNSLEVFVVAVLKRTRKHQVLALRGVLPEGHKSEKNITKLKVFVVEVLKRTRKH